MARQSKKVPAKPKVSRARTPPFAEYPEWTEAKFWSFIRSGIRGTYNKWPPKWEVLKAASRPYSGPDKRQKKEYQCAECKGWFKQKEVSVDHIVPAGAMNNWEQVPSFMKRLFVGADKLQCLHKQCHDRKTKEERIQPHAK